MSSNEIKLLGEGWYGIVIMPPLSGINGESIPPNSVAKIASYKELKHEYDFIMEYIEYSENYARLVNENNVILCKFNYDILDKEMREMIDNHVGQSKDYYELIIPYLGLTFDKYIDEYKNACYPLEKRRLLTKIIDTNTFIKYINAIHNLFNEVLTLNKNGIYHNDIKPNNLIYNEENNLLLLIDFNLSIIKTQPNYYVHSIVFNQGYKDILILIEKVLLEVLLIGFSNKNIYDKLINNYTDFLNYRANVISPIDKGYTQINNKIINEVKNKLVEFMENIVSITNSMDPNELLVENTDTDYCSKKAKVPIETQRKNAFIYNKNIENEKRERAQMTLQDIKGGTLRRSKKSQKNKNKRKRRKCTRKKN